MTLKSFLSSTTPVKIVANTNLPANEQGKHPIITPLMNNDGSPKVDNNGRPLGSVRLEQHQRTLSGTFLNARNRVAFIGGTLEELERLIAENKIVEGSELPGKIIIRESLEPIWRNQQPKMNPQTNEVVGIRNGDIFYPVYMQMSYTEDENAKDFLIRTTADAMPILMNHQIAAATMNTPVVETATIPTTEEVTE